ncbi:DsbA family protein [Corynebacterium meitnerae]|uniref:Thioredoxin domain-containing protein n=1 Tax=Corynebacterium meitnerae TaxID=2913498 RepID=A0A9X3LVD7_9CORY|nr:thioredoxin domain-containing protein [Corynebacterium meitnerae]MCZ9294911.1 thioredoxin domain-containing protein [Corynebacterium meitnerae]
MTNSTPKTKIPLLMWAFTIVFALASAVGGYIIGERDGQQNALNQIQAQMGGTKGTEGDSGAEGAGSAGEIPSDAKPGTDFSPAKAGADGFFDATIHGPGSPITAADELGNSARRDPKDPMAVGALDAPIVIAEFSDWDCPFCIRHATTVEPELMKEYVDAGYVRIEWNDMAVQGPASVAAAKAGRAAAEQGKFAEYKDAYMAAAAQKSGHPGFGLEDFISFAKKAEVPDIDKFTADAQSDKYDEAIDEARNYAQSLGVTGTPGFIVGKKFLGGAMPIENFRSTINEQL